MRGQVQQYEIRWSRSINTGVIEFTYNVRQGSLGIETKRAELTFPDAAELALVVDLLRNERPIFYDDSSQVFSSAVESAGEGES